MHFYSQSHENVLKLPIKTFWLMNDNIERISAQKDMRALSIAVNGQGGEGTQECQKRLVIEMGTIAKQDENVRDKQGFDELKRLADLM